MVAVGDDANAQMVISHLAGSGISAERPSTCRQLFYGGEPQSGVDMVILDTAAGETSGLELGRRLKSDPQTVAIPLIVIGKCAQDRRESYEIGVDDYLTCDVSREEFLLRLNGLLRANGNRRSVIASQLASEVRQRQELSDTFRRYVSPALVDQILSDSCLRNRVLEDKSVRVNATALFADMRGFTRMSEILPPIDVVPLLNEYFELLTEIVFEHEGTVFSMAGDCLMVGFGVPFPQKDATLRAVRTAQKMLIRFSELVIGWEHKFGIEVGLGIGINEGEVIAGNVGSRDYMSYTIIGDAVNVAARLGQRARAGEMLFPENVKLMLDKANMDSGAVMMPAISLRGREEPLDIFCIPVSQRLDIRTP